MTNQGFWLTYLQDWLNVNGKIRTSYESGKPPWNVVYPFAAWNIWKSRNSVVFNRKSQNPRLAADIVHQSMEFLYCVASPRGPARSIIKRVRWERPPEGWSKLNTDGAASGNLGVASYGGLVRDEHGGWLAGFSRRIGITSSFAVELWELREGLLLCSNLNISSLVVELDEKAIVDAI